MALSKITLKLGKKEISLTAKEFEELKQDMRILDKQHNYYWHSSPWYNHWYVGVRPQMTYTTTGGSLSNNQVESSGQAIGSNQLKEPNTQSGLYVEQPIQDKPNPPVFKGVVLSTE